jgi:hypothetical protein
MIISNNKRGKVVPLHTMKEYGGSRCIAPLVRKLGKGGVAWSTFRTGRFTVGREFRNLLTRRLGGPQSRSGRFEEEKKSVSPDWIQTPDVQPTANHPACTIAAREGVWV